MKLSDREIQVVRMIAEGQKSSAIAIALGITDKTVDTHRRNVLRKLGLWKTGGAGNVLLTRWAIAHGVTNVPVKPPETEIAES